MTDSYDVIKRPRLLCEGCGRAITTGIPGKEIVVLEYKPSSTLLYVCHGCASSRMALDWIVAKLEDVDSHA